MGEHYQRHGKLVGNAPTLSPNKREAIERAIETLAASRHLIGKYVPDHHWLPEHDKRIADLRTLLSALDMGVSEEMLRAGRSAWQSAIKDRNLDEWLAHMFTQMQAARLSGVAK